MQIREELRNKVIYQIYPKSFYDTNGDGIGDLKGIIEKLDYIENLGVDYIWLSPCCLSPQKDNGYDIANYEKIDPMFGTNEDYDTFLQEVKKRGMHVMMDLVLNHTSDQHEWFQKSCELDETYKDFYIWRDKPNALTSFFGGSAWTYHEGRKQYYMHFFDPGQPDLNWANPTLRKTLYAMINRWIEKGVEGFRLDVIDLIGKDPDQMISSKGPKFYEYLEELNAQTFHDRLLTVGECWGSSIEESLKMCNPQALTQAFHFQNLTLTNDGDKFDQYPLDLARLCTCVENWQNNYPGNDANVMNNHDQPRLLSVWLDDKQYRKESAKLLISIFALLKGNFYMYQGEEIGMINGHCLNIHDYKDVESINKYKEMREKGLDDECAMAKIALVSRDNARIPMQWKGDAKRGFTTGKPWMSINNPMDINVEDDLADVHGVYHYYRQILAFRKAHSAMLDETTHCNSDGNVFEMRKGNLHVVANFRNETYPKTCADTPLFTNYETASTTDLRPYEVAVYWNDER